MFLCKELDRLQRILNSQPRHSPPGYASLTPASPHLPPSPPDIQSTLTPTPLHLPPSLGYPLLSPAPLCLPPYVSTWQHVSRLRAPPPCAEPVQHLLLAPGTVLLSHQSNMVPRPLYDHLTPFPDPPSRELSTRLPAPPRVVCPDDEVPVKPQPEGEISGGCQQQPCRPSAMVQVSLQPTTTTSQLTDVITAGVGSVSVPDVAVLDHEVPVKPQPAGEFSRPRQQQPHKASAIVHVSLQPTTTTIQPTDVTTAGVGTVTVPDVAVSDHEVPVKPQPAGEFPVRRRHRIRQRLNRTRRKAGQVSSQPSTTTSLTTDATTAGVCSVPDVVVSHTSHGVPRDMAIKEFAVDQLPSQPTTTTSLSVDVIVANDSGVPDGTAAKMYVQYLRVLTYDSKQVTTIFVVVAKVEVEVVKKNFTKRRCMSCHY